MAKRNSLGKRRAEHQALLANAAEDARQREERRLKKAKSVEAKLAAAGIPAPSAAGSRRILKGLAADRLASAMEEPAICKVRKAVKKKSEKRIRKRDNLMTKEKRRVADAIMAA